MGLISQRMYESDYERQRNQFHAHSKMELIDTVNVQVSWPLDMYGSHSHNKHMALYKFYCQRECIVMKNDISQHQTSSHVH